MKINLAGETVQDLIDALRRLDPDTKTRVLSVAAEVNGGVRELVIRPNDKEQVEHMRDKLEEIQEWLDDDSLEDGEILVEVQSVLTTVLAR